MTIEDSPEPEQTTIEEPSIETEVPEPSNSQITPISAIEEPNTKTIEQMIDDFLDSDLGDILLKVAVGVIAAAFISCMLWISCQCWKSEEVGLSPKKRQQTPSEDMEA